MRSSKLLASLAIGASLVLTTACSQQDDGGEVEMTDSSAQEAVAPPVADLEASEASDAPGLTTSAAPGVAFTYSYAFSLPTEAISEVQHRHAAACEELGPQRCEVTGMTYQQEDGGAVEAQLDLLVAPGDAHRFGKTALEAVKEAEGTLASADVLGENVGGAIQSSQVRSAGFEAELARLEKRLETPGLSPQERSALAMRATELRRIIGAEEQERTTGEARLATTPMQFAYASEGIFAASGDPLGHAAATSLDSMKSTLAIILTIAGFLLPWFLLAGLLFLAWKGMRRQRPVAAASDGSLPPT